LLRSSPSPNTLPGSKKRQSFQASAGSPEKAAYNVFIAVLPGKKVALCAVGRNFDMMSDFLHAAESSLKRCSKGFRA
jgi:hypothetical protein